MDNLLKNGSMTFDKFTCTKTTLGEHFQLTSETGLFLTLSQVSFVLTMQNIIFPIFGRLILLVGVLVSDLRSIPVATQVQATPHKTRSV